MIRFRNSGSNPETQTSIIGLLYEKFQGESVFNLEEMAETIARGHLLSSNGYTGNQALAASYTENKSKDSTLMDSKLYVEIFRMLGWVVPHESGKSYPVVLSFLGEHISKSESDWQPLYEQCLMGLVTPTDLTDNVKYTEKSRPLYSILRFMKELGGVITTKEMCMGPMCQDDENPQCFTQLCSTILALRSAGHKKMNEAFALFSKELNMKESSVTNCTRFPIAALKGVGFITAASEKIGEKKLHCFRLTLKGEECLSRFENMKDLRLTEFRSYPSEVQSSLIRLGFYSMLARAGYDISSVTEIIQKDKKACRSILNGKELLFSPYQTLQKTEVDRALGVEIVVKTTEEAIRKSFSKIDKQEARIVRLKEDFHLPAFLEEADLLLVKEIRNRANKKKIGVIVKDLMKEIFSYDQQKFYPFVTSLLRIMGFPCELSRQGDHGNRWDAIINSPGRSVPVEIKSPRESEVLTLKAIRQALENKIVLLSRKTFVTVPDISSLAICYKFPNERAESQRLIEDIYSTFGYNIGVIEVETLLISAVSIILEEKSFTQEEIYRLKGFLYANI